MTGVGFRLYVITDGAGETMRDRVARALSLAPPGSVAVQLRAKALSGGPLVEEARALLAVTRPRGAPLLVNDRVDVALAAGADGVHLPSTGLPTAVARRLAPSLLVGVSTHSLDEATRAATDGADFVTFGPVWPTPSKIALGQPVGLEALAAAARAVAIPVFALGGVTLERAEACRAAGARIACIRALLGDDVTDAAAATLSFLGGAVSDER